jgi:hypothetical protein
VNGGRGLVIAIVAAFIVGCSVGMVGGIVFARFAVLPGQTMSSVFSRFAGRPIGPRHGPPHGGPMLEMLERSLDLKPDQRDRIERILEESRRGYAVVRESTHAAIERELTPAQSERWRQVEERFLRERRRGFGRPPWRGGRP